MSTADAWSAPRASSAVRATLTIPGSKSVTNRALILAALADQPSELIRPLASRDTLLMAAGLRSLGVSIAQGHDRWVVTPAPLHGPTSIDVGNAGTVMRFLPPVACLARGEVAFDGDPRSHERPLAPVIDALRQLGANVNDQGRGRLPLVIDGRGALRGGEVAIDASTSSQFVSALLLIGAATEHGVVIRHTGATLPSQPHIDMTIAMLRDVGVEVDTSDVNIWRVNHGTYHAWNGVIEPDLSNAAPFLGAAMVTRGQITIRDWPSTTTQPGDHLRTLLADMGARVELKGTELTIRGDQIHGIDRDLHDVGELSPVIAALCALADSPSRLRGISHLRLHETDRLDALATELNALGGDVTVTKDGLAINPKPLHGGLFHTYDDHRLATAGALLGLAIDGISVENIATTGKTLPNFTALWQDMLEGTA